MGKLRRCRFSQSCIPASRRFRREAGHPLKACRLLPPLLALFVLAACAPSRPFLGQNPAPTGIGHSGSAESRRALPDPGKPAILNVWLQFGQWRLVGLTGVKLEGHRSIHLLIGDGGVEAMSQCLRLGFELNYQGVGMGFDAVRARQVLPRDQLLGMDIRPSPACTRGLDRVEKAFAKLLQAPGIIERRSGGRMAFVGRGAEALFERPNELPTDLYQYTPWQMWGEWHVKSMTLRDQTVPQGRIRVLFKTTRIEGNAGCKSWLLPLQQEEDRLTIEGHEPGGCERDHLQDELAFSEIMAGDVRIAQSSSTERLLVGRTGRIRLVRPWLEPARN